MTPLLWVAQINVNLPGSAPATSPEGIVANFYQFALLIGALLAFGAIVFGGVKYALSAGSPGGQSDAKSWITDALLGLLLLLGAWLLLYVINPDLTKLFLPKLERLPVSPVPAGMTTCSQVSPGNRCRDSAVVFEITSCVRARGISVGVTTWQGTHRIGSCHFGGTSCTDGSHAVDYGFGGIAAAGLTPAAVRQAVEQCGAQRGIRVACFWEDQNGDRLGSSAGANHIHCNVDNAACGCN